MYNLDKKKELDNPKPYIYLKRYSSIPKKICYYANENTDKNYGNFCS